MWTSRLTSAARRKAPRKAPANNAWVRSRLSSSRVMTEFRVMICGNKISRCFDHVPSRSLDAADHVFDARECAQPVRRMGKIGTSNAGEEIFRAAGKARHLVRNGGAENYDRIVNSGSQPAIEVDRNCVGDQSAG